MLHLNSSRVLMHTPFPLTYRFMQSGLFFFTSLLQSKYDKHGSSVRRPNATHMTCDAASLITEDVDSYLLFGSRINISYVEHNSFTLSH